MEYLLELGQKTRRLLSGSKHERDRCPAQEGRRFKRGGYEIKRADDSFVYYLINITTQIDRQFKYKAIISKKHKVPAGVSHAPRNPRKNPSSRAQRWFCPLLRCAAVRQSETF